MRLGRFVVAALVAAGCTGELGPTTSAESATNQFRQRTQELTLSDGGQCPITVNAEAELMIRALPVVEDPLRTQWTGSLTNPSDGAWTFGRLMTQMAGPNDAEAFVRAWLAQWDQPRVVNGLTVQPRPMNALVTQPWLQASGGVRLDLTRAPMRLLAIVNRMDLRNLAAGSAGEGRFVFGVLDQFGNPMQFTVILEFNLPATTQADVDRWAADWHALGALPLGSPAYNTALEAITARFAGRNASPARPNGSAINQVRTNEIALQGPWELREFKLSPAGQLVSAPVAQTTDLPFNGSPTLAQFINQNTSTLLTATHVVPATFNGQPFLAASALTNGGHFWSAPGITNNEARFQFSINTCNGCHAGETQTPFLHVSPRSQGQVANLSRFLTGAAVFDPVNGQRRELNDLAFRQESLLAVLCRETTSPTPATVRITTPTSGATLRGTSTIQASVTGPVTAVAFFVDGQSVAPFLPPPFIFQFNADSVPPGAHTLTAQGQTSSGATVTSAPVTFNAVPAFAPDFTTRFITGPTMLAPGDPFTASVEACNRGNAFGSTEVALVFSADATINPMGDIHVGQEFVNLAPNECRTLDVRGFGSPPPGAIVPPGALGMQVRLAVVADFFNSRVEVSETNNVALRTVLLGRGPDFTISSVRPPGAVLPGSQFITNVTVCNAGNQFGVTDVEVVASEDAQIVMPEMPIGFAPRVALNPGACQTLAIQTFDPPPLRPFVSAVATRGDLELSTTNNTGPVTRLNIGAMPDFTVSSVSIPSSALPGAPFTGSTTICNNGTVASSTSVVVVLTSARTFTVNPPSPSVLQVAQFPVTLEPGRCASQSFTAPANAPGGGSSAFVGVVVDPFNAVPEFSETNNQTASSSALNIGSMPDFTVSSLTGPSAVRPGEPFTATAFVCNRGTVSAGTIVQVRIGTVRLGEAVTAVLSPNQCASVPVPSVANAPTPDFLQSLIAVADPFSGTPEFSETNNTSPVFSLAIGNAPDLVVTSLVTPSAIEPFGTFAGSVTVCNRGTAPGDGFVEVFSSPDSTITTGDNRIFGLSVGPLAPGQCGTSSFPSVVMSVPGFQQPQPPALATTFFVGAIADPFNGQVELRETNNTFARSFLLGRGPDFQVTSFSFPTTPVSLGALVAASVTACNRGTTPGTVVVNIISSTDSTIAATDPMGPNDVFVTAPSGGNDVFELLPNQCQTKTVNFLANTAQGTRGTVFFAAIADFFRGVPELNENNNVSPIRSLTVQ